MQDLGFVLVVVECNYIFCFRIWREHTALPGSKYICVSLINALLASPLHRRNPSAIRDGTIGSAGVIMNSPKHVFLPSVGKGCSRTYAIYLLANSF